MVTVSDSDHRSSTGTEFSGENLNSEVRPDNHQPRWAQVVRGELDSISSVDRSPPPSASVSAPSENDSNAMDRKKQAWKKASNGVLDADGGSVMGADAWPALVESARSSPKLVADSPLKPTGEVPVPPAAQGSINLPPQRQATNNAKSNHSLKQPLVARQRSSRRGGGGGGGGGGGSSMGSPARVFYHPLTPPPPPPFPVFQMAGSSYYNVTPAIIDPFPGNPLFSSSNIWDPRPVAGFMPQTNFAIDQRNFFPMENLAFHPHGGSHYYHTNPGRKRDHDRGVYPNVQDARFQNHMPPPRGFMSPSPPYISQLPQHVRPHGNPIPPPPEFVYAPAYPMEPYTGMPPMPPMPHYHFAMDPTLSANLVYQIEYYFSDDNLIKDPYLRSKMDDQGWVPISLIAGFSEIQKLTSNIRLIVEALRTSTEVEVQDYRIRKRNEWMKWPLNINQIRNYSSSSTPNMYDK